MFYPKMGGGYKHHVGDVGAIALLLQFYVLECWAMAIKAVWPSAMV